MGINSSLLGLEFMSGFLPAFFHSKKMLFMNRLEFSCFAGFFVRIFQTRKEYCFLQNPTVEGTVNSIEQKTRLL